MANCLIYHEDLRENSAPTQKGSPCVLPVRHIRDVKRARDCVENKRIYFLYKYVQSLYLL